LNESIDELNKQLVESRNAYEQLTRVNDQLSVESEKICQENNDLRLKYAQTHDCLLETTNSFNTFKGIRFYSNFLAPQILHKKKEL
jgi:hypothetical protein